MQKGLSFRRWLLNGGKVAALVVCVSLLLLLPFFPRVARCVSTHTVQPQQVRPFVCCRGLCNEAGVGDVGGVLLLLPPHRGAPRERRVPGLTTYTCVTHSPPRS